MLTREQTDEWIRLLCKRLRLRRPQLYWHGNIMDGFYQYATETICLGPECSLDAVVHELAHHMTPYRPRRHHGVDFYKSLSRVVRVAEDLFGHQYDWEEEGPATMKRHNKRHKDDLVLDELKK